MANLSITGTPGAAVVGQSYNFTPTVSNGSGTNTFALSGTLPGGLTFNTTNGSITGTPTAAGSFSGLSIEVTDSAGNASLPSFSIQVNPVLTLSYPNTTVVEGGTISVTPKVNGGTGTLSYTATSLPNSMSINPVSGIIFGTVNVASISTIQVTVTEASGQSVSASFTLTVINPLTLSGTPGFSEVGFTSTFTPTVTGNNSSRPLTYSISNGTLPAGLSLNTSTGVITGTPTAAGTVTVTLSVTDNVQTVSDVLTFSIYLPLTVEITPDAFYVTGRSIVLNVQVTGGVSAPAVIFTGVPPAGVTYDPNTKTLSGIPAASGTYPLTVSVTDGLKSIETAISIIVIDPITIIYPSSAYEDGYAFTLTPDVSGGQGVKTFTCEIVGTAPAGVKFDPATGILSGTVAVIDNNVQYVITAEDETGPETASVTLNVAQKVSLSGTAPIGATLRAYNFQPILTGGVAPYVFSITPTLGHNLTLNASTGLISAPALASSGNVTGVLSVTDALGETASLSINITIYALLTLSGTAQQGEVGQLYLFAPAVSNGFGTAIFSISNGVLPNGLTLDSVTGKITGTPTVSGTFNIGLAGQDETGTVTLPLTITVAQVLAISGTAPNGIIDTAYSFIPTVTGGESTKSFVLSGFLPQGMNFNTTTGALSGTPTIATQSVTVEITVSDQVTTASLSLSFGVYVPAVLSGDVPEAVVGEMFNYTPTISNGGGGQSFALTTGVLPAGLSLNTTTGQISGIPQVDGVSSIIVTLTDASGITSIGITILVGSSLAIAGVAPVSVVGQPYKFTPTVGGGTGKNVYTVKGTLPQGLTYDTTHGIISGTPTQLGSAAVTISVTDGSESAQLDVTIPIQKAVSISGTFPVAVQGTAYIFTPKTADGGGTQSFTLQSGTLPPGLNLDSSLGTVTGTPTAVGTYPIILRVTDAYTSADLSGTILVASAGTNPSTVIASSPSDFQSDTQITQYVTEYRQTMTATPLLSTAALITGMQLMARITTGIIAAPTDTVLNLLYQMHLDFESTLFTEVNFFREFSVLDSRTQTYVSAVYTGFRSVVSYSALTPPDFNYLLSITRCQRLVSYLKAKLIAS